MGVWNWEDLYFITAAQNDPVAVAFTADCTTARFSRTSTMPCGCRIFCCTVQLHRDKHDFLINSIYVQRLLLHCYNVGDINGWVKVWTSPQTNAVCEYSSRQLWRVSCGGEKTALRAHPKSRRAYLFLMKNVFDAIRRTRRRPETKVFVVVVDCHAPYGHIHRIRPCWSMSVGGSFRGLGIILRTESINLYKAGSKHPMITAICVVETAWHKALENKYVEIGQV